MAVATPNRPNRSVANRDEVVLSDRNGREYGVLTGIAQGDVRPDWDIDRAGSKGRVDIAAIQGVLEPNMWIKVYRTYIPEVGEIVRFPRGHFKLSRPSATYTGAILTGSDDALAKQSATGSDIVDSISAVILQEAFYTMAGSVIIRDVVVLIKMATCGHMGANLVSNHSFELEGAQWSSNFYNGASGSIGYSIQQQGWGTPDGLKVFRAIFSSSTTPQGGHTITSASRAIPSDAQYLYASAMVRPGVSTRLGWSLAIVFRDNDDNIIEEAHSRSNYSERKTWGWDREFMVAPVPQGATRFSVRGYTRDLDGGRTFSQCWDDFRVGTATQMPLPDDRINLPLSGAVAANRIQTMANKSIGYIAINQDRLQSIGHQALFTDMSGRLTSTPTRVTDQATPKRTYGAGDLRVIGPFEIPAGNGSIPNRFSAVKESFEEGVSPMRAVSVNNNPNDEFSVVTTGDVIDADPIYVQDAVNQDALQAVADSARDRYSTREEIHFQVLDDAGLTVNDVIEITDPAMPKALGKWAVQYIGADGPVMVVHARRAIGGW